MITNVTTAERTPGAARRTGVPRLPFLALLAALVLLTAACTGTSEEQASTLLLVGTVQGGTYQLALVEDRQDDTAVADRMNIVEDSRRDLPAPAVSIDLTFRELGRDEAWVLTRQVLGGAVSAYLHRFEVSAVDVADPAAFEEDVGARLELVLPGGGGVLPEDETINSVICPSGVQSSRDGSWLLVMDVPSECAPGSNEFPVVWLVNTVAGTASSLQFTSSDPVLGVGTYTDQVQGDERGYFLVRAITEAQVYATEFGAGSPQPFGSKFLEAEPTDLLDLAGSNLTGSGALLVGLTDDAVVAVDLAAPTGADDLEPVATTLSGARRLVVDPLGRSEKVLVLSGNRAELLHGLGDEGPDSDTVTAPFGAAGGFAGATIDPFRSYAYILIDGAIVVLDLFTGGDSGEPLRSNSFDLPGLTLPSDPSGRPIGTIAWIRAADPPPAP